MEYVTRISKKEFYFHEDKAALEKYLMQTRGVQLDTRDVKIYQVIDGHAKYLGTDKGDYTFEEIDTASEWIPAW